MYTVTFYSYKGGVGRSLLVANCALHLAQLGFRIVAVDLDLEAPGLHYKFAPVLPRGFAPQRGIVDLVFDYATRDQLYDSLRDASFEVPLGESMLESNEARRGWLRVIPAGASPSLEYWQRMAAIDWKQFLYDEGATGLEFFVDLRDRISTEFEPDFLLIDSRTGITEIGNVATSMLADRVICIVTDSPENLEGSRAVLRGLQRHRRVSDGELLEMSVAVSRPHPSVPLSTRLDAIRRFLEEPAEQLDTTLTVGTPYSLTHSPVVEQSEQLVIGQNSQLSLDYMTIAEDLVPESMWPQPETAWSTAIQSPYPYSVWNYSQLVLENPDIPVDGLYRVGRECFVVIPGFNSEMRASDGKLLSEWFDARKTLGVPIKLIDRIPNGASRVPDPSSEDLVELRDLPRNPREADTELALRLPRTFPIFRFIGGDLSTFIVEVERPLWPDERAALRRALVSLHYGRVQRPVIRVNAALTTEEPQFPRRPQGDVDLIPSRRLSSMFSKEVRDLVAKDEDLWMSRRLAIHQGELDDPSALLPHWMGSPRVRFLAGSEVSTIRSAHRLLPFCDQLVITLPLKERATELLMEMGFTREGLVALAGERRLIILLPQSTDRYDPKLLNELAQRAPESLIWSRTLCATTMIELRRRLYPWFCPGFDLRERHERLRRISTRSGDAPFDLPPSEFCKFLTHVWAREEWHTHMRGASGRGYLGGGFGTLLSTFVEHELKRDLWLEATEAGASVETAAALSAAVVPMHRSEFSLLGVTQMGAALLSSASDAQRELGPPIAFDLPDRRCSATELAHLDGPELHLVRWFIFHMKVGTQGLRIDGQDASEACRNLAKIDALRKPDGRLTLAVPDRRGGLTSPGKVDALRLRDAAAGGISPTSIRDRPDRSPKLSPIIVGELASS